MVDSGGRVIGIVAATFAHFRGVGSKIVGLIAENIIDRHVPRDDAMVRTMVIWTVWVSWSYRFQVICFVLFRFSYCIPGWCSTRRLTGSIMMWIRFEQMRFYNIWIDLLVRGIYCQHNCLVELNWPMLFWSESFRSWDGRSDMTQLKNRIGQLELPNTERLPNLHTPKPAADCHAMTSTPSTYSIPLSRLLARLESSLGDEDKINSLNEVELRKAAAVIPPP